VRGAGDKDILNWNWYEKSSQDSDVTQRGDTAREEQQ